MDRLRDLQIDRQNGKIRFDESRNFVYDSTKKRAELHVVWNGIESSGFTELADTPPADRYSGNIAADKGAVFLVGMWPTLLEDTFLEEGQTLTQIMSDPIYRWADVGREEMLGHQAIHFQGIYASEGVEGIAEVWLDSSKDYIPVRSRKTNRFVEDGKTVDETSTTLDIVVDQRLPATDRLPSIWVAKVGEVVVRSGVGVGHHRIEVLDYKRTEGWPDEHFSMKFPVGTTVADTINEVGFIAGKQVHVTNPNGPGVRYVPIKEYPQYAARTDYSKGLTEAEWQQTHWYATEQRMIREDSTPAAALGALRTPTVRETWQRWLPAVLFVSLVGLGAAVVVFWRRARKGKAS